MSRYVDIEPYEKDRWYLQKTYHNGYGVGIKTAPLISIPTADAEPIKHGRWEQVEVVHDRKDAKIQDWQQAKCSVCGKWHTTPYMYYLKLDDYCPNCGARMDLIDEDKSHPFAESVMMGMDGGENG